MRPDGCVTSPRPIPGWHRSVAKRKRPRRHGLRRRKRLRPPCDANGSSFGEIAEILSIARRRLSPDLQYVTVDHDYWVQKRAKTGACNRCGDRLGDHATLRG